MNDSNESIWVENHFQALSDLLSDGKYKSLLDDTLDFYRMNINPPFIFCLSAEKDLLSQWRAYANDGQGVCIGFNAKSLGFTNEIPWPNVHGHKTIGLVKIEYHNYRQKKKIVDLGYKIKNEVMDSSEGVNYITQFIGMGSALVNYGLIFKNPNFREEREWRIIHTPVLSDYETPLEQLSELQFRVSQNKIFTYFNYNFFDMFNSSLINEIVLGPKCQMTIPEIKQFLDHHKLTATKVFNSKSTYR